ncbi:MBL fold metallo-hydrolase, partial [Candidatus Gracilibacteria bacterium]|nr:MBL fold metallo-hydrolase [Candidatus Gracilibacteria bacterium]
IVGFQAEGTLGKKLVDKLPEVRIFGQMIPRRCEVKILNAFSAHADCDELFENVKNSHAKKVICVHGEPNSVTFLAERIRKELNLEAVFTEEKKTIEI